MSGAPARSFLKKLSPFVAALTAAAFFVGCASGGSGVRFSDLFDESARAEGTGVQFSGLVRAVVILATHEATARQRQVAEQNGRRAVAKLQARAAADARESAPAPKKKPRRKKAVVAAPTPKPKTVAGKKSEPTKIAASKPAPEPEPAPAPESEPVPKPKPAKKIPRIIAIATEKDANTDKKAAKAVMLFDTHAQKIIGNKVYDIQSEPPPGEEVRFETHSTSYIGASL